MIMRTTILILLSAALSCAETESQGASSDPLHTIAFGSCMRENRPQPVWKSIIANKPQLFLFIGDNIYADTLDISVMRDKWKKLGASEGYGELKRLCPILATWDDHDYGQNDAGREYPMKKESQQAFLDFFDEPAKSPRRTQEGIYAAQVFGPVDKRVQVILLDTRYFRSALKKHSKPLGGQDLEKREGAFGPYVPTHDPAATLLGDKQWKWLGAQLQTPAEVRIIVSSIQVVAIDHGWEGWGTMPAERARLFRLIADTKAHGVVFISGDRHAAEISVCREDAPYPLWDVTSSALNQDLSWQNEVNRYRVGCKYTKANYGLIQIDWNQKDPLLTLQVVSQKGSVVLQKRVHANELRPRN